MRMPGFTAVASLSQASVHYQMVGAFEALTGAEVVPQQLGCTTLINRSFGPLSVRLRCCLLPPQCCLRVCAPVVGCITRCLP